MNHFVALLKDRLTNWHARIESSLERLKEDAEQYEQICKLLLQAHQQAREAIRTGKKPDTQFPWDFAHGLSLMNLLGEGMEALPKDPKLFKTKVLEDGTLLGCRKWELLDPLWGEALFQWIEHLKNKASFGTNPAVLKMPNDVTFAISGDWGTGDAIAENVAAQMKQVGADYTLHVGDVYYAGAQSDEGNDFGDWPAGKQGQFTLNSNHEMYDGGKGYFGELAKHFPLQQGTSYFALYNDHWLLVGLDTAYFSDPLGLYMKGKLGVDQTQWLKTLPRGNRKVMLFSHHEGYSIDGSETTPLYQEVVAALGQVPDYWYWGHLHNVICYRPQGKLQARCIGHGAIPYGNTSVLAGKPQVDWYETQNAQDPEYPERVLNGYLKLTLNQEHLQEQLFSETGALRWQAKSV